MEYFATVEGVPADVYQSIMMAERRGLYGAPGRYEEMVELDKQYSLFSEGRPGILASEMSVLSKEVGPEVGKQNEAVKFLLAWKNIPIDNR